EAACAELASGIEVAEAECATHRDAAEAAGAAAEAAEAMLAAAGAAQAGARDAERAARAALSEAEGDAGALSAEIDGLAKLLAQEAGSGARLVDRVEVEPGFEAALGVALGDDLDADEAPDGSGASGWTAVPAYEAPPPLPAGVRPIGEVARGPGLLARR